MNEGARIVTGAASGIGRACAQALRGAPGRAILVDIDDQALGRAAASLGEDGERAVRIAGDLRQDATIERVIAAARAEGGTCALAHAAGSRAQPPMRLRSCP